MDGVWAVCALEGKARQATDGECPGELLRESALERHCLEWCEASGKAERSGQCIAVSRVRGQAMAMGNWLRAVHAAL